jgi:phosphoribosylformimino-5-aminoimidazole carboxamide ribotide isomerase
MPAIDLLNGHLARLSKGDPSTAKYYEAFRDPIQTAVHWEKEGARSLHVIDLDSAMGTGSNRNIVKQILDEVSIPVQVGGGLRSAKDIVELIRLGASRVLVGTMVLESSEEFGRVLEDIGSKRLAVALDYVDGRIVTQGWKQRTEICLDEALTNLFQIGVRIFLLTDVTRDGLMVGPDLDSLSRCRRISDVQIIAAGGIASLGDLQQLKEIGVDEVVVGKALYEERFTLKEALDAFPE